MTNPMTPSPPDEREAIVRWLRDKAKTLRSIAAMGLPVQSPIVLKDRAAQYEDAADGIEAGDHLSEQGEG